MTSRAPEVPVEVLRDRRIDLGGGVALACDVYRPAGAGRHPAIVTLLPYQKDGLGGIGGWQMHHLFAQRGYAAVIVDFRGTGSSMGQPRPPFDAGEADDGTASVEWAAAQPWCDGTVGMWGHSYGAITAMRTAARAPAALKAIVPVMGHVDSERDFVHPHGQAGWLGSLGVWGLTTLASHLTPPLRPDATHDRITRWRSRAADHAPYVIDLARRPPGHPSWRAGAIDPSAIAVPAFCVGGWRDLFNRGTLAAYERLAGPRKLLVGPWMHTMPQDSPFAAIAFLELVLAWWDRWLRGHDTPAAREDVTVFALGAERWHKLPAWPPPATALELAAVGATGSVPPDATIGVGGGLWSIPTSGFGLPGDQHADDTRALCHTGAPMDRPLLICGRPQVRITVADRSREGRLVARLTDVDPSGRSVLITSGVATVAEGDARSTLVIDLDPVAYELAIGHRLRLTLSQNDFPRLRPTSDTGLHLVGGTRSPTVLLPVVDGAAEPEPEPAPATEPPDAPAAEPLVLAARPTHVIERDELTGATTVSVGMTTTAFTPQRDALLDVVHVVAATATPDAVGTEVRGHCELRAQYAAGELRVRGDLLVTADSTSATGDVRLDGRPLLQRSWQA